MQQIVSPTKLRVGMGSAGLPALGWGKRCFLRWAKACLGARERGVRAEERGPERGDEPRKMRK